MGPLAFLQAYATLIKWAAIVIGIGGAAWGIWHLSAQHTSARYEAAISKQKLEAAAQLTAAWKQVAANDNHNAELQLQLEIKSDDLAKARTEKDGFVRIAIANAGGLRDPGRRESSADPKQATPGAPGIVACPDSGGRLSDEAAEFLRSETARANKLRDTVIVCNAYAEQIAKFRKQVEAENAAIK